MKFDVAFIDTACSKPYELNTIEEGALGGTESSTARLAEGFAKQGLKTCVIQKFDFLPVTSEAGVRYLPFRWLSMIQAENVIHIRSRQHFSNFTKSKQFIWLHDACYKEANNISDWPQYTSKYNVKCIAVSDWHIKNIHSIAPELDVIRIYSPVDELCYNYPRRADIDKNQLVWMSSPHKGLVEALQTFEKLRESNPAFKLVVFNPGYFKLSLDNIGQKPNNIRLLSESRRSIMREVVSRSLCLFYPTQFEETFGLVASEANALGVPVVSYKVAALAESSLGPFAETQEQLIQQVLEWQESRPTILGNQEFRFHNIYPQWCKLFNSN